MRRIRARADGEHGFTILETIIAMMVVFASLTALAYTASIGFRYTGYARDRIQATGIANRVMEDIRGLAYTKITGGIPTSELASDSRIVACPEYRFQSCTGEEIVSSTFDATYEAAWLVPHTDSMSVGNLDVTYSTYITNDAPTTNPYRVTVIIEWVNGAISNAPNNSVRVQSLFWSPEGCVNSTTHPFAAPCQPFFYGQVDAPQPLLSVTGRLFDFAIDFESLEVTLPGLAATAQEEQTTDLDATTKLSGITFVDSAGEESAGNQQAKADADNKAETATGVTGGGASTDVTADSLSRLVTGCCGQIGLRATVAAGDLEGRSASVDASGVDTYACPTTGTRETDLLPCSGAHARQVGTATVEVLHSHVLAPVGAANLLRVESPGTDTAGKIDRDAAGTGEDGLIDVAASRTLGTVQLGGFPTSGMTPPTGMSSTATNNTNYCVRLVGYTDSARAVAGERTSTAPSAPAPTGTFHYYNGSGYSNKVVTDTTLDTLTVTCSSGPQVVGSSTATWRVTVVSGGIVHASTTTAQTADPTDSQITWDASASTQPIEITIRYEFIVDGIWQIDLTATFDPGDLLAHAIYGPPPAQQGA
ncbi:MAG: type IV pilus modification PilV family protein [Actinomycetota bacterium]